jgi:hypothetical protein
MRDAPWIIIIIIIIIYNTDKTLIIFKWSD